jgi:hypothetical protein
VAHRRVIHATVNAIGYNGAMTVEGIVTAIKHQRLVVVCGAGITAATVPSSRFGSWRNLLEHGIETVVRLSVDEHEWAEVARRQIQIANHPSDYASVAQNISARLGKREFIKWLHETVGSLPEPERPELIQAIASLGMPIATTNYDSLIERVTNTDRVNWRDYDNMQRALNGSIPAIMHLHGSYLEPDTVIFGSESYGAIVDNNSAQSIQWLLAGGKSILFVGASGTLEDPNLGRLMAKIDENIPNSGNEHYLLCKDNERDGLVTHYKDTPIIVVPFGDDYPALPTFIEAIATAAGRSPALITRQNYNRAARDALMQRVQSESIVAIDDRESINELDKLVVPPVLLCAPHEKILSSIDEYENGKKDIRSDPVKDAQDEKIIIVVGEEISGVTTALEWLIITRTIHDTSTVPVLVDFSELTSGVRGLDRLVRRNLAESCGIPPQESLEDIVLGVDDVIPKPGSRTFDRFVDDLNSDWVSTCFLSCALGAEAELIAALEERGLSPAVRYMGRMTKRDVRALVLLTVDDERAEAMLEKVQQTLNVEGLPKTAWNIALLLDVFIKTSLTIQSITPITLLDQFVSSLLGREIYEDSRISIDARDREAILSALASLYARSRAGALPEEDVISFLTGLFEEYGWNESPTAMLESLKARHVLTTRRSDPKNIVRFAQSSYLYLFAAKQAKDDHVFKEELLDDALFFSKIITHYSSLVRNDEWVLEQVHQFVDRDVCTDDRAATIFGPAPVDDAEHPLGLDSVVAAVTSAEDAVEVTEDAGIQSQQSEEQDRDDNLDYYVENAIVRSSEPFPARSVRDAPHLQKALTALSLVSNVLRDSELVRNMPLKVKTLKKTVHLWTDMVYLFEQDEDFKELAATLAEELSYDSDNTDAQNTKSKDRLEFQFPLFFCLTAMMGSLSSRKLEVAIKQCFDELVDESPKAAIMTALLSWSTESQYWPSQFAKAAENFRETPAVFDVMFVLAKFYYVHEKMSAEQRTDAERFFRIILERGGYNVGMFMERLRVDRARASASTKVLGH